MKHKAFEVVGEKILLLRELYEDEINMLRHGPKYQLTDKIIETGYEEMCGIFQRSDPIKDTMAGGKGEIDFIEPIYNEEIIEVGMAIDIDKGRKPKGRLNQKNPTLRIHYGIDVSILKYCEDDKLPTFRGKLFPNIVGDDTFNDGHIDIFNQYVEPLRKAGFKAYEVES